MSEVVKTVSKTIPCPLDDVWAVMHRTADLSITDGWRTIKRTSDSAWVGELQGKHVTCETSFDEANHTAEVVMHNSMKRRTVDTTFLKATPAEEGTEITLTTTIRGGAITMFMLRLTGETGMDQLSYNVISNIEALCTGGEAHDLSQEELEAIAKTRVEELDRELNK